MQFFQHNEIHRLHRGLSRNSAIEFQQQSESPGQNQCATVLFPPSPRGSVAMVGIRFLLDLHNSARTGMEMVLAIAEIKY